MEPDERGQNGQLFIPYDDVMASIAAKMRISVTFDQLPIKDLSVPTEHHMTRILNQIDLCIKHGKPVYVHCLGGIGRTGTVVGCYLMRHRLATSENVLEMIRDLRKDYGGFRKGVAGDEGAEGNGGGMAGTGLTTSWNFI